MLSSIFNRARSGRRHPDIIPPLIFLHLHSQQRQIANSSRANLRLGHTSRLSTSPLPSRSHDTTKQQRMHTPSNPGLRIPPQPHLIASECGDTEVIDVAAFRDHWEEVLEEHEVPEPTWSVKWIMEHVLRGGRSTYHVTQERDHVTQERDHVTQGRDRAMHKGSMEEVLF